MDTVFYPYVVIGAGAAGLVMSIGLAKRGKQVALIEKSHFGGDCTHFGCVPSKALIEVAKNVYAAKHLSKFHINSELNIQPQLCMNYVREKIAHFAEEESPETLFGLGVNVIKGSAQFINPHTLEVTDGEVKKYIQAKKIYICTGSKPKIPKIEGLEKVPYLTNETIFYEKEIPSSLIILGGGPIGCELAQAFGRLGTRIILLTNSKSILEHEDPQSIELIKQQFKKENIHFHCQVELISAHYEKQECVITYKKNHNVEVARAQHLLIATGRVPQTESLALEKVNILLHENGIITDSYGRTNQKNIYALGDCSGPPYYTHLAEHHARMALANTVNPFFSFTIKPKHVPHVIFIDPEIASIGLSEYQAYAQYGKKAIHTYYIDLAKVDRACIAGESGFIKIVTKNYSSKILGATIVAKRAGEMIMEIAVCMENNIPLRKLSSIIHPYPTYTRGIRKAADGWLTKIFS